MFDLDEDPDEQVAYLVRLTKSDNRLLAEQAQDTLDRLAKRYDPSQLRGPNGRWIHVGSPAVGTRVNHPEHGRGVVTGFEEGTTRMRQDGAGFSYSAAGGTTHIRFDDGTEHSFEHPQTPHTNHRPGDDFHSRDIEVRGRNLTQDARETGAEGRAALGAGQFDAAIRQAQRANAKKPMTDAEFVDRANMLEKVLDKETVDKYNSATLHKTNGAWNPARVKQQQEIVDAIWAEKAHVPSEGKAVISGGLGGAGKTTTLKGHAGIDPDNWITVNPDDIKEEMAKRGMVPDVPGHPELSPLERATLIHQESGIIAEMLAERAYGEKKNVIWDITMGSGAGWLKDGLIGGLREKGYGDIRGVFVDIPVETSVQRAMGRYRQGVDDFRAGKPDALGGRYVPPHIIRAQEAANGHTVNRGIFDSLKSEFDDWSLYDNSGSAPVHVESKG